MSRRRRGEDDALVLDDSEDEEVAGHAARKQRLAPDWPAGAILEVRMQNFMTYNDVSVQPGPRLNLILGPNGTGKSSLVCAICVCLAGKTNVRGAPPSPVSAASLASDTCDLAQLLGRAKDVREYIKRGERSALVQVTLSSGNPAKPTVVSRKISDSDDGPAKNEWKLNGVVVNQTKVAEVVEALNIQLDNLCQFLPQDRVVEFAAMQPKELLLETEKALGEQELFVQHQQLMAAKADIADLEKSVAMEKERMGRLKEEKGALERDVERFKQREALVAQADALREKLPWLLYDAAREKCNESKSHWGEAKNSLAAKEKALESVCGPLKAKQVALEKTTAAHDEIKRKLLAADKAGVQAEDAADELRAAVEKAMDDHKHATKRIATKSKRLDKAKSDLADAEANLAKLPPPGQNTSEAEDIRVRQRDLERERRSAQEGSDELGQELEKAQKLLDAARAQLRQLDSVRGQRLEALATLNQGHASANIRRADAEVAHAVSQGRFKDKVYGPLACEVADLSSRDVAAFLEQQCEAFLWTSYMAQNAEDQSVLQKLLLPLRITVLRHNGATDRTFARPVPADSVKDLGVVGTLDEQFSAPEAVKAVLCDMGGLSRAYVATQEGDRHAEELCARRGLGTLWTPSNQYVCSRSRHSNATSLRMVPKRDARVFTQQGTSAAAKEALQAKIRELDAGVQKLKARKAGLDEQLGDITSSMGDMSRRREALEKQKQALERERVKLTKAVASRREVLAAEEEATDDAGDLEKHKKACDTSRRRLVAHALKAAGIQISTASLAAERAVAQLAMTEAKEHVRVLAVQSEGYTGAVKQAKELAASLEALYKRDKEHALKLNNEAKAQAPLTPEREAAFVAMPNTVDDLQARIDSTMEEADAILCPNPSVMQNYLRINSELAALEKTHGEKAATLSGKQAVIDATKEAWLPRLRQLFGRINTAFSAAFSAIGCAGEVRLCEAPNDDFTSYAVDILVKFRAEEQLQKLTANRQSGGERSVSTMLYLISLQDLTRCPFRVVDEINQGMDPKNERKIFRQMVASACAPGTPQCFLLTPKLLPQLDYSPEVTVLGIFNGPWIKQVSTGFDSDTFLGKKRAAE